MMISLFDLFIFGKATPRQFRLIPDFDDHFNSPSSFHNLIQVSWQSIELSDNCLYYIVCQIVFYSPFEVMVNNFNCHTIVADCNQTNQIALIPFKRRSHSVELY
jgi:hypothetical protein